MKKTIVLWVSLAVLPSILAGANFDVTSTADSGAGSLRQAILDANGSPGLDSISFNIAGDGVQTISVLSALPAITDPVDINGYSQPGSFTNTQIVGNDAVLMVEVNGNNGPYDGFVITGGTSSISGLVINRFGSNAIVLRDGADNFIVGNFIGTSADGTAELNNGGGIFIDNSPRNVIGGSATADRNVILGNTQPAIHTPVPAGSDPGDAAGGNRIQGNYIGTNATGTVALGGTQIFLSNPSNTIGGTSVGARNVISTQFRPAIHLDENGAHSNRILGNYIGVTSAGNAVLGNGNIGISIERGSFNIIGGTTAGARNVIVADSGGISIFGVSGVADGNVVQGNYIGTNAAGTSALPLGGSAGAGIHINSSTNTLVGNSTAGARNVIAGFNTGVHISTSFPVSTGNVVQGNFIGTNAAGTARLGNGRGVAITSGQGSQPTTGNLIGGTVAGTRNVISGNDDGVFISGGNGNTVHGNLIGVAADGVTALGNTTHGINITSGNNNIVGGTSTGAANVIAFNGDFASDDGVVVFAGTGNSIRGNSIFSNFNLGIDLGANGVTANDSGDSDLGANNLQNYPVITSVNIDGTTTTISGTLNSTPATTFTLDFYSNPSCDSSGNGEGQTYRGSTFVATDASGNGSFTFVLASALPAGHVITATATSPTGNTSEFSACRAVSACSYSIAPASQSFGSTGGSSSVTVTATPGCDWTAVSNAAWITITAGASGSGDGSVSYSVAANSGPARAGMMTIAGQTFTVNQDAGCTYSISPTSQQFSAAGGTGSVAVTTAAGCDWTATSNAGWITIQMGGSGSDSGTVSYSVESNTGVARTGTLTVAGQTFTVNQDTGCTYAISPRTENFNASGGNGTITVTTGDGCNWTAVSNADWISVTSGASGSASGSVSYTVATNNGPARSGTLSVAGHSFTVTQDADCAVTISPSGAQYGAEGGSGNVTVTTADGCGWTATSNNTWITITSASSGSGDGNVAYSVASNSGPARSGSLTVGGQTFTVQQASGCSYTISPQSQHFTSAGGNGQVSIATAGGCDWTATSNDSWITITSSDSGSGSDAVSFSVAANSGADRTGTLTVAGQTFTVTQDARVQGKTATTLTYTGDTVIANGGTATLSAILREEGGSVIADRIVTFTLGEGGNAQTCSAVTNAAGQAQCSISPVSQPLGPGMVLAAFAGDDAYLSSSTAAPTLIFAFAHGGNFVIGDMNSSVGSSVTFWGAQWWKRNSLSGGSMRSDFKGFAEKSGSCGSQWSSDPGNSPPPPDSIPAYLAVLVSSAMTKNGVEVSGNIVRVVIVQTNPGYSPNPGHSGTGTVVAVVCGGQ